MCEYQSVECAFTSPVSIKSGMLVTCRMQYAMFVSTVLWCGDVVSLGGKYAFATVMSFVFPMCILISCRPVLCVLMALGMFMFMKVMSSLISVMSPSLFVLSVCAYGGVVGYFCCLALCVSLVSCIVMMSGWVLCTMFFSSLILFLMPFMLI